MTVCLVRCAEPREDVRKAIKTYRMEALTPEKLRICEHLVRFHASHGQKIMIFSNRHWHLRHLERMFPFAMAPSGDTDHADLMRMEATFKEGITQVHPLVWITISRGEIGFDVPDTSVVINLANAGESASRLRQRMGRASRKQYKFGWFYDLVGDGETPWAERVAGDGAATTDELRGLATRYKLLFKDGYGPDLIRLTSQQLSERINAHVASLASDEDDAMQMVHEAASALCIDPGPVMTTHNALLATDHLVACAWGSHLFYHTDEDRRDQTLFDTQSQIAAQSKQLQREQELQRREREKAVAQQHRRRNSMLLPKQRSKAPVRKAPSASSSTSPAPSTATHEPVLLSLEDYITKYKMPSIIRDNALLRKTIVETMGLSTEGSAFLCETSESDPNVLWDGMMRLRSHVNTMQFNSDRGRLAACRDVLQMGEDIQERCTFLH